MVKEAPVKKFIPRPPEAPEIIEARWEKKKARIEELANGIRRLRTNISRDINSDNEKTAITALIISIMDITAERIGNEKSEKEGHLGITGLQKNNITINGNSVSLDYVGKSGVKHEKCFTNERVAKALKSVMKNSSDKFVFTTTKGLRIKSGQVNNYLEEFKISSKNIRGYSANKWTIEKLKLIEPEDTDKKRKKQLNKILKQVAEKVGHGRPTLRKHYLIPELWDEWVNEGKVINIKEMGYLEKGGEAAEVAAVVAEPIEIKSTEPENKSVPVMEERRKAFKEYYANHGALIFGGY